MTYKEADVVTLLKITIEDPKDDYVILKEPEVLGSGNGRGSVGCCSLPSSSSSLRSCSSVGDGFWCSRWWWSKLILVLIFLDVVGIHPSALKHGGNPLVACCISAAKKATGSSRVAHAKGITVDAELGRLSRTKDDLTVEDYDAKLTDVNQAQEFIDDTGIDALAVCTANVHMKYPASGPKLRLQLLKVVEGFKGVRSCNKIESLSSVKLNLLKSITITSIFLADSYLSLLGKLNFD
ncbi:unnamed protein product [Lactuca saligna]|uniref:Uncharacterized protein n=1 Tax=Lactuca saligna TaxID=75948 RepID=A0AA35V7P0_LACSI|nr:unnamed protein product [Lactuca saligna]